jgi:pSer/pThr/pTyr-binding forkhead associated (FHA) protein
LASVVVELNGSEVLRTPLKAASLIIGRDKAADIHLDNRALSRRHAKLEKKGAAIWIQDMGSQNGTYVNGQRIEAPRALNGGDVIEVGRYQLRIEGVEEADANTPVLTLSGPEGKHRFAMVGEEIIIGRAPSCDIAIGHKSISRRHLRISHAAAQFYVEDLGSQNGTRINGRRINGKTPFSVGDEVQMSDFTMQLGFLEPEPAAGEGMEERANKTMMIDRSELAKAAYVDGDFDKMRSSAGRLALGRGELDNGGRYGALDEIDEESATRGLPQTPTPPPARRPSTRARGNGFKVTIVHPDVGEREIRIGGDVTVVGEDGTDHDSTNGLSFANQGYLMFTSTGETLVVSVVGDRRLPAVNGRAMLYAKLEPGDTIEFGVLTAVFEP